jgi:hypothetical protein
MSGWFANLAITLELKFDTSLEVSNSENLEDRMEKETSPVEILSVSK